MNRLSRNRPNPARRCPTCRQEVGDDSPAKPFCSDRCRMVDLGRWMDESYRVSRPIEEADLDEEA